MHTDDEILSKYSQKNPWGMLSSIDLRNCDPNLIKDEGAIKDFVEKLCDLIEMKRYGETVVVEFGDDPRVHGFSMTQLIETSLISGHFANETNTVYLDIFSCKAYPPYKAAEFAKEFFKADEFDVNIVFRT